MGVMTQYAIAITILISNFDRVESCPSKCMCTTDFFKSVKRADCHARDLTSVQNNIPTDTEDM